MAEKEYLENRKNLEEIFFAEQNRRLLEQLREKGEKQARKAAMTEVTGITDDAVLEQMLDADLCAETVTALYLIPLVEVAWADCEMHDKERDAILRSAEEHGMGKESIAYQMLQSWLGEPPKSQLLTVWKGFVKAMAGAVDANAFATMKDGILKRARSVAEAAGGFLGLAKISAKEKEMLAELESAFGS